MTIVGALAMTRLGAVAMTELGTLANGGSRETGYA